MFVLSDAFHSDCFKMYAERRISTKAKAQLFNNTMYLPYEQTILIKHFLNSMSLALYIQIFLNFNLA